MLNMRESQLQVLSRPIERRFEERMELHLRSFFADFVESLETGEGEGEGEGEEGALRAHVRASLAAGRAHGIRSEQGLCLYLNLSVAWGPKIEAEPEQAWVCAYLEDADVPDGEQRIRRLYAEALRREQVTAENARIQEEFWHARS